MRPTPLNSRTTTKENPMSVMTDIKNTVDATPFFAAVGATDLAVEKVREARVLSLIHISEPTRPY